LTINAAPEPVRKGQVVTVAGVLTRASWDAHRYRGTPRVALTLETRRPDDPTYVPLKSVRTDGKGRALVKLPAGQDVCFRFVYAGSDTTAPVASGGDCVDVR